MEQNSQNSYLIPLAVVVAGGFVAAAIYFGAGPKNSTTTINTDTQNAEIDLVPVTEKDHIIGSRNATLVIVEYSDTECPFCKT
ncbi:MAG: thioredoxin domain-containing protein, partial [bacterium]|nr:thioredoxin domain-containing protein [bacterium]